MEVFFHPCLAGDICECGEQCKNHVGSAPAEQDTYCISLTDSMCQSLSVQDLNAVCSKYARISGSVVKVR